MSDYKPGDALSGGYTVKAVQTTPSGDLVTLTKAGELPTVLTAREVAAKTRKRKALNASDDGSVGVAVKPDYVDALNKNTPYRPRSLVWVRSLNTMARVRSVSKAKNGEFVYKLDLVSKTGGAKGEATTTHKDLVLRRNKALKGEAKKGRTFADRLSEIARQLVRIHDSGRDLNSVERGARMYGKLLGNAVNDALRSGLGINRNTINAAERIARELQGANFSDWPDAAVLEKHARALNGLSRNTGGKAITKSRASNLMALIQMGFRMLQARGGDTFERKREVQVRINQAKQLVAGLPKYRNALMELQRDLQSGDYGGGERRAELLLPGFALVKARKAGSQAQQAEVEGKACKDIPLKEEMKDLLALLAALQHTDDAGRRAAAERAFQDVWRGAHNEVWKVRNTLVRAEHQFGRHQYQAAIRLVAAAIPYVGQQQRNDQARERFTQHRQRSASKKSVEDHLLAAAKAVVPALSEGIDPRGRVEALDTKLADALNEGALWPASLPDAELAQAATKSILPLVLAGDRAGAQAHATVALKALERAAKANSTKVSTQQEIKDVLDLAIRIRRDVDLSRDKPSQWRALEWNIDEIRRALFHEHEADRGETRQILTQASSFVNHGRNEPQDRRLKWIESAIEQIQKAWQSSSKLKSFPLKSGAGMLALAGDLKILSGDLDAGKVCEAARFDDLAKACDAARYDADKNLSEAGRQAVERCKTCIEQAKLLCPGGKLAARGSEDYTKTMNALAQAAFMATLANGRMSVRSAARYAGLEWADAKSLMREPQGE